MRIRFGDCLLDSETRELLCGAQHTHVSPRAFQLLTVLLERRPKAVSKEELHEILWPRTFVSDTTLAGLVAEIRAAIGDDARSPRFIRTLPVFGYAFSGEAVETARERRGPAPYFYRLIWGGREVPLAEGDNVLGRGPESVVWIDDESVSRRHARIRIAADAATLEDLGSKNGTFLKGRRLDAPATITDGDQIRLGAVPMRFRVFRGAVSTQSLLTD